MNYMIFVVGNRLMSSTVGAATSEATRTTNDEKLHFNGRRPTDIPPNYRFVFPEFLPDPDMNHRNNIREKLERYDMLDRR